MRQKLRFSTLLCFMTVCGIFLVLSATDALYTEASVPMDHTLAIIRLHVIPNSDMPADQDLKLRVRNDVLALLANMPQTSNGSTVEHATEQLAGQVPRIESVVKQRLRSEGVDQDVTIQLGHKTYETRPYLGRDIPAGEYISLEVILGEGKGENFWCIIFPSFCFVPDDVQLLSEERSRGNVAEAAEPGKIASTSSVPTFVFRWRIWERLGDSRTASDNAETDQMIVAVSHAAEDPEAASTQ